MGPPEIVGRQAEHSEQEIDFPTGGSVFVAVREIIYSSPEGGLKLMSAGMMVKLLREKGWDPMCLIVIRR